MRFSASATAAPSAAAAFGCGYSTENRIHAATGCACFRCLDSKCLKFNTGFPVAGVSTAAAAAAWVPAVLHTARTNFVNIISVSSSVIFSSVAAARRRSSNLRQFRQLLVWRATSALQKYAERSCPVVRGSYCESRAGN